MRGAATGRIGVPALLLVLVATAQAPAQEYAEVHREDRIEARVWLDRGDRPVVHRGDRLRLYYRTAADAYVAIFQIDTDGGVRLLNPRSPAEDHYVRGGRDYRLLFRRSAYWHVDDPPGVGYFFIVASRRPMDFSRLRYTHGAGGWDLSPVGRRVYRDPYLAMDDYVAALVPGWEGGAYSLHVSEYHVDRAYRYPRFLCYDCHAFRPYRSWNPYHYRCRSFRVVIYTDPVFYPVRRYGPRRVVYTGVRVPDRPRFAFKERVTGEPAGPLVRRRARPAGPERTASPRARGRDPQGDEPRIRAPEVRRRGAEPEVRGPEPAGRGSRPPVRPSARIRGADGVRPGASGGRIGTDGPAADRREERREQPPATARPRRPSAILPEAREGGPPRLRGRSGNPERDRVGDRPATGERARPFLQPRDRESPRPGLRPESRPGSGADRPRVRTRPPGPEGSARPTARPKSGGTPSAAVGRGGSRGPGIQRRPAVKPGGSGESGRGGVRVRPPEKKKKPPPS